MSPIARPTEKRWAEDVAELEVSRDAVEVTLMTPMTTTEQEVEAEASMPILNIERQRLQRLELLLPQSLEWLSISEANHVDEAGHDQSLASELVPKSQELA